LLPNQAYDSKAYFNKITDITQDESLSRSTSNIEQLGFEFTDTVSQIFKTIEQVF
jgi:hypothetical protein